MSDTPGGPDWFKAQDGKWYPPQPQTPAQPQFANQKKKGGCLKVFLIGLAVIIVLIVLVSVGASSSNNKTKKADQATCAGKTYPDQQSKDKCADATNTVAMGGVAVTATGLTSSTDSLGTKQLCSNVTIKNTSSSSQDYNVLNFKIQPPSGNIGTANTLGNGTLNSGTLIKGASTSGTVCMDDQGEKGQYVLIYKPNPFESDRGIWLSTVS